jgi:hypothetical protein
MPVACRLWAVRPCSVKISGANFRIQNVKKDFFKVRRCHLRNPSDMGGGQMETPRGLQADAGQEAALQRRRACKS